MRTTLEIDDDVLMAAKERAYREGRSIGSVVSDLARAALTAPRTDDSDKSFLGFRPLPRRGGLVTSQVVLDLLVEGDA